MSLDPNEEAGRQAEGPASELRAGALPAAGEASPAAAAPGRRAVLRRKVMPFVLAGAMLASAAGGGVAGGVATLAWAGRQPTSSAAATTLPPPLQSVGYAATAQAVDVAAVYRQVSPAVVAVNVSSASRRGFGPSVQGQGTGVVVDEAGHILTNNHVVEGSQKVAVTLADGTQLAATVVGADPASDLAVIQATIPKDKLAVAKLGDSDGVTPGEPAIAIGTPFGLDHTVTAGIVSAVQRDWGSAGGRPMRGLIQTDAPINPGNSGGPLLNSRGEVIGITTAIESPVRGSVGIGFAVPINRARQLLPKLVKGQTIEHPWLGISGVAITSDLAQQASLSVQQGILVAQVVPDGPADRAGLRGSERADSAVPTGGDVITAVDGKAIKSVQELSGYLDTKQVGDTVTLKVIRDGQPLDVVATLSAWPVEEQAS